MDLFTEFENQSPPETSTVKPKPLSVTGLTRLIKGALEDQLPAIFVHGEISNLNRHSSGHIYFTLKDEQSQIRCVVWRSQAVDMTFSPDDGLHVLVKGRIALYEKGGYYQIVVSQIQPEGQGALQQAFERLKKKLYDEGLFDPIQKKPLPEFTNRIGIITSPTGAAIRDIVSIVRRRQPWAELFFAPVQVQGTGSTEAIVQAIKDFESAGVVDVLIIGRGGGSLEDMQPFNDERVARAIAACSVPTVSAVGHEIDFTIADFVADVRAATPSAAAELVTTDRVTMSGQIENLRRRIESAVQAKISYYRDRLDHIRRRYGFRQPENILAQYRQQTDEYERRLKQEVFHQVEFNRQSLLHLERHMQILNPKNTLKRGYTITRQQSKIITKADEFDAKKETAIEFYDGEKTIHPKNSR